MVNPSQGVCAFRDFRGVGAPNRVDLSLRSALNGESQTDWRGMAAWVFGQCLDRTGARLVLHHAIACQITLPVPPWVIRAQDAVR